MSRYYGDFGNSYGGSGKACGGSRNPHNSSPPIDQYDGDSSRGYNHYSKDHQNEGNYADNRRLIENNGRGGLSHQNKYSTRYDDLIDSRRDTNRYSDSLGSRQDPYSRMGGSNNDDYDGEYRNYRSTQYRDSRHNDDATDHRYGNQPSKSTDDDDPHNRYGARHKSPADNFAHGDRYRNGGKSFDEVNAGYGYALRNDDAARRYMPENDDRYVHDGGPGGRHHHHHHQRDRHYYY